MYGTGFGLGGALGALEGSGWSAADASALATKWYVLYLGRQPDAQGLQHWITEIQNDGPALAWQNFSGSSEPIQADATNKATQLAPWFGGPTVLPPVGAPPIVPPSLDVSIGGYYPSTGITSSAPPSTPTYTTPPSSATTFKNPDGTATYDGAPYSATDLLNPYNIKHLLGVQTPTAPPSTVPHPVTTMPAATAGVSSVSPTVLLLLAAAAAIGFVLTSRTRGPGEP